MKKIKKKLAIFLIILLSFSQFIYSTALAEEEESPPEVQQQEIQSVSSQEPAESQSSPLEVSLSSDPQLEAENQGEVINEIGSTAISGENSITKPTPTPFSDSSSLEPTPTSQLEPEEASPTPTPSQTVIETGDAFSLVEVENSVNTNKINSEFENQTLNVFSDGDINLADGSSEEEMETEKEEGSGSLFLAGENETYLENNISSLANTGQNEISGQENAQITTGNAYSVVSVLNQVNTTVVDSKIKVFTINIFGDIEGNIILPEPNFSSGEVGEGEVIQIENQSLVKNMIDSLAISGQNEAITSARVEIETGDAQSVVNLVNFVNTSLIGVNFFSLSINNFGGWEGNFLGLGEFGFHEGGKSLVLNSLSSSAGETCFSSCFENLSFKNQAVVINKISSFANSGRNYINGQDGEIKTGKAISVVSVFNFINTSIVNSFGILGSINIFGFLKGDIGGESYFLTPTPTQSPIPEIGGPSGNEEENILSANLTDENSSSAYEEGGMLEVEQKNNVGDYVFPGDTITFFVTVKNRGTGKVYDTHLKISMIKDGQDMGGGMFDLGDIGAKKGIKMTFGLVLSKEAKPGDYLARATVWGRVGPQNQEVSASSDSLFKVKGKVFPSLDLGINQETWANETEEEVLGAVASGRNNFKDQGLKLALLGSLISYLAITVARKRKLSFSLDSFRSLATKISSLLS